MIIHNPILTGSFTVNGTDVSSITSSAASLTSLNAYTASQNILNGTYTLTSSFAAQTASFTAFTSSVNSFTASQLVLNGTYATTGSNTFAGIQTVNSNLVVTGSITAQTLVVQTITSSVDFVTGSTRFGSSLSTSTHQFTGSVSITGSLDVVTNGTEFQVTSTGINFGNALTDSHIISGSLTINPNGLFVSSSGNVGIGITDLGPTGLSLPATSNYAWSEGSGNAYAVLFRQRNSGATVIASGYKRSNTAGFASSFGTSMSRAAIAIGSNNGSIAFFSDSATNVANGTDITPTERMTITNAGSVGIGITSPGASLAVANTTVGTPSIPSLGSINGYTTAFFSNSNPVYGLLMGSLYNGNTWMQVGRIDGTATAYDLQLQPNGGGVNVGGRLSVGTEISMGTNQRLKLSGGAGNLKGSAQASISSTTVTVFEGYELAGVQSGNLVIVSGVKSGTGWNFTDLVNYMTNGTVTVFSSSTVGSPPARTYTVSGTNLRLSIAGGDTGLCSATGLTQGYQA